MFWGTLIYHGHGGDGFLKFQDTEEMNAMELSDVFQQMHEKKRYNELLFMIDTCQAGSMVLPIKSPNIIGVGSSTVGQDSLSHHGDHEIGVYVIDRWTYYTLDFLEKIRPNSQAKLKELFSNPQTLPSLTGSTLQRISDQHPNIPT
eukprot:sb/3473847/